MIANSTMSSSTLRPLIATTTKLPIEESTARETDDDDENAQTTEETSSESDVVEEPSVEEIDNEAWVTVVSRQ